MLAVAGLFVAEAVFGLLVDDVVFALFDCAEGGRSDFAETLVA